MAYNISIHEAFADLDFLSQLTVLPIPHFNPRGLRRPRQALDSHVANLAVFQSTRPSQTSTRLLPNGILILLFQSTRPSQTST